MHAAESSTSKGQYWYDGSGKRVKKFDPSTGETTIFVYDAAGKMIAEYSAVVASVNDAKVAYVTTDPLGSPRITTDANGSVIARRDYHPFGERAISSSRLAHPEYGGDGVRKQFATYERDDETDKDFAQARYYDSASGRFSSPDPFGGNLLAPQSLNRYSYVLNNPLNLVDPTGLQCLETESSGPNDKCIWVYKEGKGYASVWQSQYDAGSHAGFSVVADPSAVHFVLTSLTDSYATDEEYKALIGSPVKLGVGGRLELDEDAVLANDTLEDSGFSIGGTAGMSGGIGFPGLAGIMFEVSLSDMIFMTNRGVRDHTFLTGAIAGSAFGHKFGYPRQEGPPVILGAFGGVNIGPVISTATRPDQIAGSFQTIQGTISLAEFGVAGGLQFSPTTTSGNLCYAPGGGAGGYGNVTTNTWDITENAGPTGIGQWIINSTPRRP